MDTDNDYGFRASDFNVVHMRMMMMNSIKHTIGLAADKRPHVDIHD